MNKKIIPAEASFFVPVVKVLFDHSRMRRSLETAAVGTKAPKRNLPFQSNPVCALCKLAGFADRAVFVDSAQSQTRYSYGEPIAMANDSGTSYFGTDILGSVRSVTDKYGTVQADYSYDAFGSPYLGNLENDIGFGYCGKVYDIGTGLYDYGFRDYSPVSARFTTVDPIRDGSNWFSYVVNDPVNYVDPLGLSTSDRSSSPNFNAGMFGQNVGFNGFTVNTQTGNNSQSSISPFGSYFSATTITGYKLDLGGAKPKTTGLMNLGNIIHETGISFADNTIGTSDGLNYFINDTPYYYVILPENPMSVYEFENLTVEEKKAYIDRMIVAPFSQSEAGLAIDAPINSETRTVRKIATGGVCRAYEDVIDGKLVILYEATNDTVGSLASLYRNITKGKGKFYSKPGTYSQDEYPEDIKNWFSQYPYIENAFDEANRRKSAGE